MPSLENGVLRPSRQDAGMIDDLPTATAMPEVAGVRHRRVHANGSGFHVAEAGAGQPVLLLHGWPQHWLVWRSVIPLLAPHRRVICLDLRGFGWSDAPRGDYAKEALAQDVFGVLDVLELERVDLIAHDWGAWIGFLMCIERPERIGRYLALNIVTPWADATPSLSVALGLWRLWYQVVLATPFLGRALLRHTGFVRRLITTGAVHPDAWSAADLDSFSAVLREPARADASTQLYRTFLLRELVPFATGRYRGRRSTVPTVLLHGTRDIAIDHRNLGDWRSWADEMSLELRDDSGHFIAEELPAVVAARALALFDGARPSDVVAAGRA
jgi:pimeloyl-ACP methyl ester carboxylesterase